MYVITRRDLSQGLQFAQSVHVALEWADDWDLVDDTVIVLTVADEKELVRLYLDLLQEYGDEGCSWFKEPDLDMAVTAITAPSECKRMLRHLPLAGL